MQIKHLSVGNNMEADLGVEDAFQKMNNNLRTEREKAVMKWLRVDSIAEAIDRIVTLKANGFELVMEETPLEYEEIRSDGDLVKLVATQTVTLKLKKKEES